MSTIKETTTLLKMGVLINLFLPKNTKVTMLLSGAPGAGKTAVIHELASITKGFCLVVEGGSTKDGEITGLPYGFKNPIDGAMEVRFTPHQTVAAIKRLEKLVYERATTKGFLNGQVKMNIETGETIYETKRAKGVLSAESEEAKIILGEDNKYTFGEDLPPEVQMELLESGDIKPVILLIDEMNRTENQTMKEFMNIVLTKTINGYRLPWWVFIVSAINPCGPDSVYSTNDMDAAQLDRFLRIKVSATLSEWIDWALDNNINTDYITALSTAEEIFQYKGKGYEESESVDLNPTPRSHTICSYIYDKKDEIMNSSFFTAEERKNADNYMRTLFIGKLGRKAGNAMLAALRNKENYINPADILTGKEKILSPKIEEKIQRMKAIGKRILLKNLSKYIAQNLGEVYFEQSSKDSKVASAAKIKWANVLAQLKALMSILDSASQLLFAKDSIDTKIDLQNEKYAKWNGRKNLYDLIAATFSFEIISQVAMTNNVVTSGEIDKK